jgi:lipoprotein-anchoring transpeptidase ErfK/SrfK
VPVSTGGGYTYYSKRAEANVTASTPRGDFELLRYSSGWSCDPLYGWCIYKPWNFTSVYAIHGYNSVPAYPASHGCVRIPNWDADILEQQWYVGLPVHVWDVPPEDLPLVGG